MATITAGMPVLNGAGTIARAIEDILAQTHRDMRLVVCDNASEDNTADIARQYAARDPRVEVRRFENRVDIRENFRRAYEAAETEFFMFAPADDRWYPQFAEKNLQALKARPDAIASTGRAAFTVKGRFSHISDGTRALDDEDKGRNVVEYIKNPGENARAFSLFRREALADAFPDKTYPGWDFQMIARTLLNGGYLELNDVLSEREVTPVEDYIVQAEKHFNSRLWSVVPLSQFVLEMLKDRRFAGIKGKRRALWELFRNSHATYAKHRMPRWYGLLQRAGNGLALEELPDHQSLRND